jgi:hypothetical protein
MNLYLCLKDDAPLCQRDAAMVFESEKDAYDVLTDEGVEGSVVAEVEARVIVEKLRSGGIEQIFYVPDDQGPGFVSLDKFDGVFNPTPEGREENIKRAKEAILRRQLMEMAARGEVEWDLDTDTYKFIPPEEREAK